MTNTKRIMKTIDWIVLIVAIFVVFAIAYKITGGKVDPSSIQTTTSDVTIQLEVYAKEPRMLEHIKAKDVLSEAKRNLNAVVTDVQMVDLEGPRVLIDERRTEVVNVDQAKALVTIKATTDIKGVSIKLGSQDIRVGKMIFLESELYKLSGRVLKVED